MEKLAFGPFLLDPAANRLLRSGVETELRPRAVRALQVLVRHTGRCVDYQQMIQEAWDGTVVSRHTVAVTVGEVKKALKEYRCWITFRHNRGYCLQAPQSDELLRTGWHFWNRRTREGFDKALACFEQLAREDNSDARAFEGIAVCSLALALYSMRPPREMYPKFLEAHERAAALGGVTLALRLDRATGLQAFERRFDQAESELLDARREEPRIAAVYIRLAMLYTAQGRLDDALEVVEQARAVDPLWPMLPATETVVRFCRREYDLAVAIGKTALELHPYLQLGRAHYAEALELSGQKGPALEQYRLACAISPDLPWLRVLETACLARSGRLAEALSIRSELEQLRRTEYVDAYYMALLCSAVGDPDQAFQELERARRENSVTLSLLDVDPKMDALRKDSRFSRFRNRLFHGAAAENLPAAPRETDPDLAVPVSAT